MNKLFLTFALLETACFANNTNLENLESTNSATQNVEQNVIAHKNYSELSDEELINEFCNGIIRERAAQGFIIDVEKCMDNTQRALFEIFERANYDIQLADNLDSIFFPQSNYTNYKIKGKLVNALLPENDRIKFSDKNINKRNIRNKINKKYDDLSAKVNFLLFQCYIEDISDDLITIEDVIAHVNYYANCIKLINEGVNKFLIKEYKDYKDINHFLVLYAGLRSEYYHFNENFLTGFTERKYCTSTIIDHMYDLMFTSEHMLKYISSKKYHNKYRQIEYNSFIENVLFEILEGSTEGDYYEIPDRHNLRKNDTDDEKDPFEKAYSTKLCSGLRAPSYEIIDKNLILLDLRDTNIGNNAYVYINNEELTNSVTSNNMTPEMLQVAYTLVNMSRSHISTANNSVSTQSSNQDVRSTEQNEENAQHAPRVMNLGQNIHEIAVRNGDISIDQEVESDVQQDQNEEQIDQNARPTEQNVVATQQNASPMAPNAQQMPQNIQPMQQNPRPIAQTAQQPMTQNPRPMAQQQVQYTHPINNAGNGQYYVPQNQNMVNMMAQRPQNAQQMPQNVQNARPIAQTAQQSMAPNAQNPRPMGQQQVQYTHPINNVGNGQYYVPQNQNMVNMMAQRPQNAQQMHQNIQPMTQNARPMAPNVQNARPMAQQQVQYTHPINNAGNGQYYVPQNQNMVNMMAQRPQNAQQMPQNIQPMAQNARPMAPNAQNPRPMPQNVHNAQQMAQQQNINAVKMLCDKVLNAYARQDQGLLFIHSQVHTLEPIVSKVEAQKNMTASQEEILSLKSVALSSKEEELSGREQVLVEKEQGLAAKEQELIRKAQELEAKEKELHSKEETLKMEDRVHKSFYDKMMDDLQQFIKPSTISSNNKDNDAKRVMEENDSDSQENKKTRKDDKIDYYSIDSDSSYSE